MRKFWLLFGFILLAGNLLLAKNVFQKGNDAYQKGQFEQAILYYESILKDKKGNVLAANEYWKANTATGHFKAFNQLPVVTLSSKAVRLVTNQIKVELENKTKHPAVGIKLDALNNAAQIVLPAYFSDGYFTLLPGEKKTILLEPVDTKAIKEIKVAGYNVTGVVSIKN